MMRIVYSFNVLLLLVAEEFCDLKRFKCLILPVDAPVLVSGLCKLIACLQYNRIHSRPIFQPTEQVQLSSWSKYFVCIQTIGQDFTIASACNLASPTSYVQTCLLAEAAVLFFIAQESGVIRVTEGQFSVKFQC